MRVRLYAYKARRGLGGLSGVEAQLESLRSYAAQRGWDIVGEHFDCGPGNRPELVRLLKLAVAEPFDALLVEGTWRLSRDIARMYSIVRWLAEAEIEVRTPTGRFPGGKDLAANYFFSQWDALVIPQSTVRKRRPAARLASDIHDAHRGVKKI